MATEKVRLVLMVEEELRHALRLEAARRDVDMSDIIAELLTEHLADALAEARKRRQQQAQSDKKPGRKSKPADDDES